MRKRNTTAILFLITTIVVAFFNVLIDKYQYIVFAVPFAAACIVRGRASKISELVGLFLVGSYIFLVEKEYTGMMILYGAACLYFTYFKANAYFYIVFSSLLVGILSFLGYTGNVSRIVHGFMDGFLYAMGTSALYIMIHNALKESSDKTKSIDAKYLDVIDELQRLAHESIEILKSKMDGCDE